jgi:hypothetical protein
MHRTLTVFAVAVGPAFATLTLGLAGTAAADGISSPVRVALTSGCTPDPVTSPPLLGLSRKDRRLPALRRHPVTDPVDESPRPSGTSLGAATRLRTSRTCT